MADLRRSLHKLELKGVEVTDQEIGRGAYGVVSKVKYKGMICAGKEIHQELATADSDQSVHICDRFEKECLQLSNLRHPNITSFLGVYFPTPNATIPLLIMEFVPISLDECLKQYPDLPDYVKNNILFDVATGLAYLHGLDEPVIHRDLTAKNVLVSENFRGKIADMGVAKIVNVEISNYKMTEIPGNASYMPPEAFMEDPKYTEKLDMFSFGNLILHTVNHVWPTPHGALFKQSGKNVKMIAEIERRAAHLDKMGDDHLLKELTVQCLDNDPERRPTALKAADVIQKIITANPPPVTNLFEMMKHVVTNAKSNIKLQERINSLEQEQESLQQSNNEMVERLKAREERVAALKEELQATKDLMDSLPPQAMNAETQEEVKQKIQSAKDGRIQALGHEIEIFERNKMQKVNLLDPTMELHWEKLPDLPVARKHPQVVELNGKVYVGSGYASTDDLSHMIYAYNLETSVWETLPKTETRWYAMTVFEGQLLLLGGMQQDGTITLKVYGYKENANSDNQWIPDCIPEMLDPPRCAASAVSVMSHIVLAGGFTATKNRTNIVDVYESDNKQWFRSEPLLKKAAEIKTALLNGDIWYLLGGANQVKEVYSTSLQSTIFQATNSIMFSMEVAMNSATNDINNTSSKREEDSPYKESASDSETNDMSSMTSPVWTKLPNVPYESSSVAIFGNTLLSLGGETKKLLGAAVGYSNAIHMYVPHMTSNPWIHIADLPIAVCRAGVLTLKSREMMMIGGRTKGHKNSSEVYKCTLQQREPNVQN